jgi:hypothetical protein
LYRHNHQWKKENEIQITAQMPSSKASNWKFDVFGKALRKIDKSP